MKFLKLLVVVALWYVPLLHATATVSPQIGHLSGVSTTVGNTTVYHAVGQNVGVYSSGNTVVVPSLLGLALQSGVSVSYDANAATAGAPPAVQTKDIDVSLILATNSGNLVRTGFTFTGWNTQADGLGTNYAEGASYAVDASMTLFAKWHASAGGDGTEGNPYQIADWNHLNNIRNYLDAHFVLNNSLNENSTGYATHVKNDGILANDGKGWIPLGNAATKFTGQLDGAGFTISHLGIFRVDEDNIGLFGFVESAVIKNLGLIAVNVVGREQVGGLTGQIIGASTVSNAYAAGTVSGETRVGGLIGWVNSAQTTITDVYADVTVGTLIDISGGLVGNNAGTISSAYSLGQVTGNGIKGGLVGQNSGTVGITNFWNTTVNAGLTSAGGVGKTTTELKTPATFTDAGWSITSTASIIYPGQPYPGLRMAADGAVWQLTAYAVTYNANGANSGNPPNAQAKGHDIALILAANSGNLQRIGYSFVGWNTQADGLGTDYAAEASYTANTAVTLYAKWTINQYTITFNSDGGSAVGAITQNFGSAVIAPANPTKEGYTFAGWNPLLPATMPASNVTHTAQWTINPYTITFNSDGGSAVAVITQDFGTAVTAPANPTKAGYTFAGWDPVLPATMPASSVTHTAQWTINQYTITFDSDGGSAVTPITQNFGTAVTAPANPTKEGYIFAGWVPALPATMPANDTNITAQWSALPAITTHPVSKTIIVGQPVAFAVVATSVDSYQWYKNDEQITGAIHDIYSIDNAQSADAGSYKVVVANGFGMVTSNIASLMVTPDSTDADLSALEVFDASSTLLTLVPVFNPNTLNYETVLDNGNTVNLNVTAALAGATLTIDGHPATSGETTTHAFAVQSGAVTSIPVMVTGSDGTLKTYTVSITKAKSNNANLSSLAPSVGVLNEVFDKDTTSYTLDLSHETTSIRLTPDVELKASTITVNSQAVQRGKPSQAIALGVGATHIPVVVTAEDGTSTKSYTLSVNRASTAGVKEAVEIGYQPGDSSASVTKNLTLPTTGESGAVVTWLSNDTSSISHTGVVTRPDYVDGDKRVTLTATITNGDASETKAFIVNVKRNAYLSPVMQIASNLVITETADNNGAVAGDVVLSITGGVFKADVVEGIQLNNLPAGLGFDVARSADGATLTLTFNGAASSHSAEFSIDTASITVLREYIEGSETALTTKPFAFAFRDPARLSVVEAVINEAATDDYGTGVIDETITVNLAHGTFAADMAGGVTVNHLPAGLGLNVARNSDTQLTISFTGAATSHTNHHNVANASITIAANKMSGSATALTSNTFKINFNEPVPFLQMVQPEISESTANDGSLEGSLSADLYHGHFAGGITASDITVFNLPYGLAVSAVTVDGSRLTVSFSGNALFHRTIDSVDDVKIGVAAAKITPTTTKIGSAELINLGDLGIVWVESTTFAVQFREPPPALALDKAIITDNHDGTITETLTVTLQHGQFLDDITDAVRVNNLPDGVGINVVRTDSTRLEITFTGVPLSKNTASTEASVTVSNTIITTAASNLTSSTFHFDAPSARALVHEDRENLAVIYALNENEAHVLSDVGLATSLLNGSTITWNSSHPDVITNEGIVTRPNVVEGDKTVTLTATLTNGGVTVTKEFTLIVRMFLTLIYTAGDNGVIEGNSPQTIQQGASGSEVTAVPDIGYYFVKWSDDSTDNPRTDSAVMANITVAAAFTINQYTITFDSDGGSAVSPITQDFGSAVIGPASPTKEGYIFAGWSPLLPATMPANDINVTAQWILNTFTVTVSISGDGTVTPASQQVDGGQMASFELNVTDDSYVQISSGCAASRINNNIITAAIFDDCSIALTVYPAVQVEIDDSSPVGSLVTRRFRLSGGAGEQVLTALQQTRSGASAWLALDDAKTLLTLQQDGSYLFNAERTGRYTFEFVDSVSGEVVSISFDVLPYFAFTASSQPVQQDIAAQARVWLSDEPIDYPVRVTVSGQHAALDSSMVQLLAADERRGSFTVTVTTDADGMLMLEADSLEQALLGTPLSHRLAVQAGPLPLVLQANVTQDAVEGMVVQQTGGVVELKASELNGVIADFSWQAAGIQLIGNGAVVSFDPSGFALGRYYIQLAAETDERQGELELAINVIGVCPVADCSNRGTSGIPASQNPQAHMPNRLPMCSLANVNNRVVQCQGQTLSQFIEVPNQYQLMLGLFSEQQSWQSGQFGAALNEGSLADTGYLHIGFMVNMDVLGLQSPGESVPVAIPMPEGQMIPAGAVWRKLVNTLWQDFTEDNANRIDSAPRSVLGNCPGVSADSWRPGLNEGDSCIRLMIEDGGPNDDDGRMNGVIRDPGVLAVQHIASISFNSAGGSAVDAITGLVGSALTAPDAPAREGYTFSGWQPEFPTTMPEDDMQLTAQWLINQYVIRFDVAGGQAMQDIVLDFGAAINVPPPSRVGYTFSGWTPALPATMPATDVQVRAQWQPSSVTVTSSGGGFGLLSVFVLSGLLLLRRLRCKKSAFKLAVASVLLLPMLVWSQDWYLGAQGGVASSHSSGNLASAVERKLNSQGIDGTVTLNNNSDTAYRLFVGYQLNHWLAAELGWLDLGEAVLHYDGLPPNQPLLTLKAQPQRGRGAELSLVGRLQLNNAWQPYARLALFNNRSRYQLDGPESDVVTRSRGTHFGAEVGVGYQWDPQWQISVAAAHYNTTNFSTRFYSLGLRYSF